MPKTRLGEFEGSRASADALLGFEYPDGKPGAGEYNGGGQPIRPAADNYDVDHGVTHSVTADGSRFACASTLPA
ncbi:hypothetical protein GCM10027056_03400 [Glaciibacter psychrotolerans]